MSESSNTDGLFAYPPEEGWMGNPLKSIECAIAFDVADWSIDHRRAWIYGIVFGWGEALDTICKRYEWDEKDKKRLMHLHEKWEKTKAWLDEEGG